MGFGRPRPPPDAAEARRYSDQYPGPIGTDDRNAAQSSADAIHDVRIRRALLPAINQQDFVIAVAGNVPSLWRTGVGLLTPGSPMANDAGLSALTGPRDLARARREIAAAGYKGERVVVPASADAAAAKRAADVGVDMLTKIGLNVDYQIADAGTFMQRRDKKGPVDQGGGAVISLSFPAWIWLIPALPLIRGNGAYLGWPKSGRIESLRRQWLEAIDDAKRRELAEAIQVQAFEDVLYIPLAAFTRSPPLGT